MQNLPSILIISDMEDWFPVCTISVHFTSIQAYGSLEASSSSLGSVTFPLIDLSLVCKVGPGHRSPRLLGGLGRVLRVAVRDLEFPSVWLREESTFPHHCHCPPLAAFLGLAFSTSILSWGLIQVVARFNSLLLFIAE